MAEIIFNHAAIASILRGPGGMVAADLTRRALRVETRAKQLCPVDTGRLRSSISHRIGADRVGLFADIGTNVLYGVYQEFGTRYMAPQPFLIPALLAAA